MTTTKRWYPIFIVSAGFLCFTIYQTSLKQNRGYQESPESKVQYSIQSVIANSEITTASEIEAEGTSQDCITLQSDFKGVSQEDPRLIDCIRRHLIQPPSPYPYNLKFPEKVDFSQYNQSKFADKTLFHGMRDGFFLEVGALDGEHLSNSLYFERELGWRGLLIEPLPHVYQALLKKNRKAFTINAALATSTEPSEVSFIVDGINGGLSHIAPKRRDKVEKLKSLPLYSLISNHLEVDNKERVKVKAIPLYSILRALNVTVIDFFSLDIESFEVKVLKTLPWDKVKFRVMCIEINHIPEGLPHLTKFLTGKGYEFLGVKVLDAWFRWPKPLNETR